MSDKTRKRQYPRLYIEVPATISSIEKGDGFCALMTRQLGKGGCMLMGSEYLGAGHTISIRLALGDQSVTTTAQVLYESEDKGLILSGTKFIEIDEDDARVLDLFLENNVERGEVGKSSHSN